SVDLSSKVAGRVASVAVREGDRVKAGDVLVRVDLGETSLAVKRDAEGVKAAQAHVKDMEVGSRRAEIAAAEAEVQDRRAAVELARKELERRRSLLEHRVGSQEDYDTAKTALDRAVAAEKMSEERLQLQREGFRRFQTEQAQAELSRAESVLSQSETVAKE